MNFLLTNDDGVTAPGLWAAASALAELGRVLVVAPSGNCSGFGAAYPPGQSLSFFPYSNGADHPAGVVAFGVNAMPATCAHVGLSGLFGFEHIDLVVSGVNEGANMGRDVFYSGTVGAALTAHFLGKPAIAFSLAVEPSSRPCWETTRHIVRQVVMMWRDEAQLCNSPEHTAPLLYNVNVPNRDTAALRGLRLTGLSTHSFLPAGRFERAAERPDDQTTYMLIRRLHTAARPGHELWSDAWAVEQDYVSITPLRPTHNTLSADWWGSPATLLQAEQHYAAAR
ncbi:MAG: 5'/3'-nucleotidase SurE [Anaerolineae bacterium]|nr:hypothetical protein [Thermoflexales bacterium]MDW8408154.1 5'/3'-nucleotidase SurE [Anaerolineae bacterium]